MPLFTLTKKALADLVEIGRYTQKRWGKEQRNTYLTMLDGCFQQLAAAPLEGRACDEIRSGYRKMNVGSHVIFYRQSRIDEIEIVRVLHERMDIESRLSGTS
jgi:toxin ParE1/3/4